MKKQELEKMEKNKTVSERSESETKNIDGWNSNKKIISWFIIITMLFGIAFLLENSYIIVLLFILGTISSTILFKNQRDQFITAQQININLIILYSVATLLTIVAFYLGVDIANFITPIVVLLLLYLFFNLYGIDYKINIKVLLEKLKWLPVIITSIISLGLGYLFYFYRESITFASVNIASIGIFVIFVGLSEELIFRYYLQNSLEKYLNVYWAIFLQALLFLMFHFNKDANVILYGLLFGFAILMGAVKVRFGIIYTIIMHAITNAVLIYLTAII